MPVLMYHHVGPVPPPGFEKYSVTPDRLARQLTWLRHLGYTTVTLNRLIDKWDRRCDATRDVALTFDDGYHDCFEYAAPVLASCGVSATFFLVSGQMGRIGDWLVRDRGIALAIMNWSAARQLARAGFEIGAHSVTHPRLALIERSTARDELLESKARIEHELGREVAHVAYPHGSCSETVIEEARAAGYRSGCTTEVGIAGPRHCRWALPRVPIDGREGICDFIARVKSGRPARTLLRAVCSRLSMSAPHAEATR